ncbi:MAG TPA: hypothetical protein PLX84_15325, partial [Acidiphilium sp.]|nr:hypothetical protein [Acidiphilium sp.]
MRARHGLHALDRAHPLHADDPRRDAVRTGCVDIERMRPHTEQRARNRMSRRAHDRQALPLETNFGAIMRGGFDPDRQEIRLSEKFGGVAMLWRFVEAARRAGCGNAPVAHQRDLVAKRDGLALIVRDVNDGQFRQSGVEAAKFFQKPGPQRGIEGGKRFVEQQDRRADRQRAGNRDTLLLPA